LRRYPSKRVLQLARTAGVCGQVEDGVALGDDVAELAAREIDRHEVELSPLPRQLRIARLGRARVVVVEAVDTDDRVAATQ
jgi:hypothetical protein